MKDRTHLVLSKARDLAYAVGGEGLSLNTANKGIGPVVVHVVLIAFQGTGR